MSRAAITVAPACLWVLLAAGCADRADLASGDLEITVGALTLSEVTNASYTITVANTDEPPQPVWSQSGVTSAVYGNSRGSLFYLGPCDASTPQNTVTLTLDALYETVNDVEVEIPQDRWSNPTPVSLLADCVENQDTGVEFNLVIMRAAGQGFFDIVVNFSDIFCSAKLGCGEELLFDGDQRSLTFLAAFACASGIGEPTWLGMDDYLLECTNDDFASVTVIALDPSQSNGQHGPLGDDAVFEHGIYSGTENLEGLDKCYWNLAIGVRQTYLDQFQKCRISGRATAAGSAWPTDTTPPYTAYPYVDFEVLVWDADDSGLICQDHPLDGEPTGVTTRYTAIDPFGLPFPHRRMCGGEDALCDVGGIALSASGLPGAGEIEISASLGEEYATGRFQLPGGVTLVGFPGCCEVCCSFE